MDIYLLSLWHLITEHDNGHLFRAWYAESGTSGKSATVRLLVNFHTFGLKIHVGTAIITKLAAQIKRSYVGVSNILN